VRGNFAGLAFLPVKTAALIVRYLFFVQLACAGILVVAGQLELFIAAALGVLFWGGLAYVLARGVAEEERKAEAKEAREQWLRAKSVGTYGRESRAESVRRKNRGEGEPEI